MGFPARPAEIPESKPRCEQWIVLLAAGILTISVAYPGTMRWIVGAKDLADARKKLAEFTLEGRANRIECPMLIGYSKDDRIMDLSALRLYQAATNAKREMVEGTGHNQVPTPAVQRTARAGFPGLGCQAFGGRKLIIYLAVFFFVLNELIEVYVVFADHFRNVPIGPQPVQQAAAPGLGVSLGILDGDVNLQRLGIHPAHALHHVEIFAVRVTCPIDPGFIVKADRIHYQSVSVPMADESPIQLGPKSVLCARPSVQIWRMK